jgi:hypothetical protein
MFLFQLELTHRSPHTNVIQQLGMDYLVCKTINQKRRGMEVHQVITGVSFMMGSKGEGKIIQIFIQGEATGEKRLYIGVGYSKDD